MAPHLEPLDMINDEGRPSLDANERTHSHRNGRVLVRFLLHMVGIVWFLSNSRVRSTPPDPGVGKAGTFNRLHEGNSGFAFYYPVASGSLNDFKASRKTHVDQELEWKSAGPDGLSVNL